MAFLSKTLENQETLGERLCARREALGFTRETAARAAGLPVKYLTALEEGRYRFIPGVLYVRQYLRLYNGVLGFDIKELLAVAEEECRLLGANDPLLHTQRVTPTLVRRQPLFQAVRKISWGAGLATMTVVMGFSLWHFFDAPMVEIANPSDGVVIAQRSISVAGRTDPESNVTINGQTVIKAQDGSFTETVELKSGVNTLRIVAQKKHSLARVIERRILVE